MFRKLPPRLQSQAGSQQRAYSKPASYVERSEPSPDWNYNTGSEALQNKLNDMEKLKNREWKHRFTLPYWRAAFAAYGFSTVYLGAMFAGSTVVAIPFIFYQWQEILGFDLEMTTQDRTMPFHTPQWWLNEWRKQSTPWRRSESWLDSSYFHLRAFDWLQHCTGRDFLRSATGGHASAKVAPAELAPAGGSNATAITTPSLAQVASAKAAAAAAPASAKTRMRALVPMCGDSPIVKVLANAGYEVDAIDSTDIAIRELADRLDVVFGDAPEMGAWLHLHLQDIFSPHAWKSETGVEEAREAFDLIWDRQGLTAVDPARRNDYAFLLKRALKPNGVMYIEGCNRTARRKKNRANGPPFHVTTPELEELFPSSQGYRVQCDEVRELVLADLDSESRVTGIIPEYLLARHFPCAVWKDAKKLQDLALAR
jgi:hypothetical protein